MSVMSDTSAGPTLSGSLEDRRSLTGADHKKSSASTSAEYGHPNDFNHLSGMGHLHEPPNSGLSASEFCVGDQVVLTGLVAAHNLNGSEGSVLRWSEDPYGT